MGDGRQDGGKSSQGLKPPCAPSGFLGGPDSKESAYNAGDRSSLPGAGGSPGEGNGKHSRILAWATPWTEEPGGLQSMGSQRVRHD